MDNVKSDLLQAMLETACKVWVSYVYIENTISNSEKSVPKILWVEGDAHHLCKSEEQGQEFEAVQLFDFGAIDRLRP